MKNISSYGKGLSLGNVTSLSSNSKLEDFIIFFFFRKIVIVQLKCRLFTLEMTIFIYGGYKRIGGI